RTHRGVLLGVLRRLPRAGQDTGLRGCCTARTGLGAGRAGAGTLGPAPAPGPDPPLRDRRGVVMVAGGFDPHRPVAHGIRVRPRTRLRRAGASRPSTWSP